MRSFLRFYSYGACRSTPDCYKKHESGCPFDSHDHGYDTKMTCNNFGKYSDCACKFQGQQLTASIYNDYPFDDPGK